MIPKQLKLGQCFSRPLSFAFLMYQDNKDEKNTIMGFKIPVFQRPLVWTKQQQIKLIESLWLGIPIGSYSVNMLSSLHKDFEKYDRLLIDGQQRLNSIQLYIENNFKVFDLYWDDLTIIEKRRFRNIVFPTYETTSTDINYLQNYYNLMNYGGTSHD